MWTRTGVHRAQKFLPSSAPLVNIQGSVSTWQRIQSRVREGITLSFCRYLGSVCCDAQTLFRTLSVALAADISYRLRLCATTGCLTDLSTWILIYSILPCQLRSLDFILQFCITSEPNEFLPSRFILFRAQQLEHCCPSPLEEE